MRDRRFRNSKGKKVDQEHELGVKGTFSTHTSPIITSRCRPLVDAARFSRSSVAASAELIMTIFLSMKCRVTMSPIDKRVLGTGYR